MTHSTARPRTPRTRRSPKDRSPDDKPSPQTKVTDSSTTPPASDDPPARFVGLDVHKKQITYCILDAAGETIREGEIVLTRKRLTWFAFK